MNRTSSHSVCWAAVAVMLGACSGTATTVSSIGIQLEPRAELVELSKEDPPDKCHYIGNVEGLEDRASRILFSRVDVLERDTAIALRNKGAALGGNFVQIDPEDHRENTGLAYRCEHLPIPAIVVTQATVKTTAVPPAAITTAPSPVDHHKSVYDRLTELNQLYEDGLIDQEEYETTKARILLEL